MNTEEKNAGETQEHKDAETPKVTDATQDDEVTLESQQDSTPNGPPATADDVELEAEGLDQDFKQQAGTEDMKSQPKIEKPNAKSTGWFCISPKSEHRMRVALNEANEKGKNTFNIVAKAMMKVLAGDFSVKTLFLCQTEEGRFFWWPVRTHAANGFLDSWSESALTAITQHSNQWLRRKADTDGAYEFRIAPDKTPPDWDAIDLADIKARTLKGDVVVRDENHKVAKRILGK
jgi:hypothetical protein